MKTILFICTGNVCRSPMAEALFRHAVAGRGEFRALSAGLGAVDGQPPTTHSVTAMRERGIDISSQRSRALTTALLQGGRLRFWHDARPRGSHRPAVSAGNGKDLPAARV